MAKPKTHEEAIEAVESLKQEVKDNKEKLTAYLKENKLKRNNLPEPDSKHGKKIAKIEKSIERSREKLEKAKQTAKDLKPKKERAVKYDYPEGMTAEEKKKYRAKMRAQANKAGKPKKKKKVKEEAPAKEKAPKKKKKAKKSKHEDD